LLDFTTLRLAVRESSGRPAGGASEALLPPRAGIFGGYHKLNAVPSMTNRTKKIQTKTKTFQLLAEL
jgi:hypothetical protein